MEEYQASMPRPDKSRRVYRRGEEHRDRLRREGDCNAFIRNPTATKSMFDAVQAIHPKTLSACFVMSTATSKANPDVLFRDMVRSVTES